MDRSRSSFDAQMMHATELLTGETQRRSAGVAILEGSIRRLRKAAHPRWLSKYFEGWRLATMGLLSNQVIYLLEVSQQGKRPDEKRNLERMIVLLGKLDEPEKNEFHIAAVLCSLEKRLLASRHSVLGLTLNPDEVRALICKLPVSTSNPKAVERSEPG